MTLEIKKRIITSIFLFLILFCMFIDNNFLIGVLFIASSIAFFEFINLQIKINKRNKINLCLFSGLFLLYLLFFSIFFYALMLAPHTRIFLFITVLICIASDVSGLIFGKLFKGKKLTKISPNKTISGSLGSFIGSFLIISLFIYFNLVGSSYHLIVYTFFTSLFCQLGDIFISYLKRKAKVKDTGNLLPGHGGILDRLDGILFGIPFGVFSFYVINI